MAGQDLTVSDAEINQKFMLAMVCQQNNIHEKILLKLSMLTLLMSAHI
jgi:hypothetical protein